MSYLIELLENKKNLDKKIKELSAELKHDQTEIMAEKLFSLIDERQSVLLDIQAANNISKINIGGRDVSITTAVLVRDTIKRKMVVLTSLIEDESCELDKIELQSQRDKFHAEYVLLSMGILKNDLQVKVN